jgi:hypothetical protein
MADDVLNLLNANRSSSVLQGIANPAQVNPLAAIMVGNQAAQADLATQKMLADRAAGRAFLNSIDPNTGQSNQANLLRGLQSDPTTAFAAQRSAQEGQTLDQGTFDLHNKRLTSGMAGMGQLIADNPNGVPQEAAAGFIDRRLAQGLFTPDQARVLHGMISSDPVKNTQLILQGMASNLSGQTALQAARPGTGDISTGQGRQGYQTPPALSATATPGAMTPVGGRIAEGLPTVSDMLKQVGQPVTDPKMAAALGVPVGTIVDIPMIQRWNDQGAGSLATGGAPPPGSAVGPAGPNPIVNVPGRGNQVAPTFNPQTEQPQVPGQPPIPYLSTTPPPMPPGARPDSPATHGRGPAAAPSYKPVVSANPPGMVGAAEDTAKASAQAGNALMARADQVPTNKANYANMQDDISKLSSMGPGTDKEAYVNSLVQKWTGKNWGTMTPDQIRAANSFSKLANIAVGQQLAAMGGTDARQQLFMGSNPHLDLSKLSNAYLTGMLQGNEDAINAKANAWQAWQKAGNGPHTYSAFQSDFNQHFDPRVFQQQYMKAGSDELATMLKGMRNPDGSPNAAGRKFQNDVLHAREQGWIQ